MSDLDGRRLRASDLPSCDDVDPLAPLVRMRWESERRRIETERLARALASFALFWPVTAFAEAFVVGFRPLALLLELSLAAAAMALAMRFGRRRARVAVEAWTAAAILSSVAATLLAHRLGGAATVRFDGVAALPILWFAAVVGTTGAISTAAAVGGATAVAGALIADLGGGLDGAAAVATAFGMAALGVAAGRLHTADLARAHLARLRADLAAHRLTHHNDALRVLSEVDPLTGVANRRSIERRLAEIAEQARGEAETIGVMMIDVDHFKAFNDRHGHQEGDRCLAMVAKAAAEQIRRKADLFGRFGGEEFLAVLPGAGLDVTIRVAERIRVAVERRAIAAASGRPVTVSIGCASGLVGEGADLDELLRRADEELYAAKNGGRNRVLPPSPSQEDPTGAGERAAA
ncbi:MAG: GGDEF domain-containing protein [Hyphomicrobiales bacterium]|nr:GGDEF domain-containing protein [Hyphomicrobiales bacterium]